MIEPQPIGIEIKYARYTFAVNDIRCIIMHLILDTEEWTERGTELCTGRLLFCLTGQNTDPNIYIYIYLCVCVCVCIYTYTQYTHIHIYTHAVHGVVAPFSHFYHLYNGIKENHAIRSAVHTHTHTHTHTYAQERERERQEQSAAFFSPGRFINGGRKSIRDEYRSQNSVHYSTLAVFTSMCVWMCVCVGGCDVCVGRGCKLVGCSSLCVCVCWSAKKGIINF